VIDVEDLSCRMGGQHVLDHVGFTLHQGECLAVVGANGAGKTTLLRHLIGLQKPAAGRIRLQGQNIAGLSVARLATCIGLAFQNPDSQFFRLNVQAEIDTGPRVLDRYDKEWIRELVALFGLTPYLDRAPYRLSGGEKKRVAFASALAARPAVLALDEPTAGQDFHFRRALQTFLSRLRPHGLAVILVTHDLAFAEQCADRWLVMAQGRLLADGPPQQVMADSAVMARAGLAPTDRFELTRRRVQKGPHA
jgi:energy-coupling factor transport system ATP-binding protein